MVGTPGAVEVQGPGPQLADAFDPEDARTVGGAQIVGAESAIADQHSIVRCLAVPV